MQVISRINRIKMATPWDSDYVSTRLKERVWRQGWKTMYQGITISSLITLLCLSSALAISYPDVARAQALDPDWTAPMDMTAPETEGTDVSPVLLCDDYENLHLLWGKTYESGSALFYRNDLTGRWSGPLDVVAMPDLTVARLSADISMSGDTLHVVWQNSYIKGEVYYARAPLSSAADPRSWTSPVVLAYDVDSAGVKAGKGGELYLIYGTSDESGLRNSVQWITSLDGGLTWSDPATVYETASAVPSTIAAGLAVDGIGRWFVTITIRSQEYGLYSEAGYIRSLDGGRSWQSYEVIARQSEARPNISGAAAFTFGDNEVHQTWYDPRRMHRWSYDGGDTWRDPIEIMSLGAAFGGGNELVKDSAGGLHVVTGVLGGIYSSHWDGSRWSAPELIDDRLRDWHGWRLEPCQGDRLNVVYDDRLEDDSAIWYSSRQVNAPHIDQSPIPTSVAESATESGSLEASPTARPAATAEPAPPVTERGPSATDRRALAPLLTPTVLVAVLISVALAFHKWRGP
ncbi:MAG: exo-alpha-sialidase [bacterium]